MTEHPLHALAMAIRYDLTAAQGKLTELVRQIGELDLPEPVERGSFTNGPVLADQCAGCGVGGGLHTDDCVAVVSPQASIEAAKARVDTDAQRRCLLADAPPAFITAREDLMEHYGTVDNAA